MGATTFLTLNGDRTEVPAAALAEFADRLRDYDVLAQWMEPDQEEACIAWARETREADSPHTDGVYMNHLGQDDEARMRSAYGSNYDRLV